MILEKLGYLKKAKILEKLGVGKSQGVEKAMVFEKSYGFGKQTNVLENRGRCAAFYLGENNVFQKSIVSLQCRATFLSTRHPVLVVPEGGGEQKYIKLI